jgi:murein DD-endopeptidase MepM/ murein hydrolase activator NlpD
MNRVGVRRALAWQRAGSAVRIASVATIAAGLAACSADTGRFTDNPFSSSREMASAAPPPRSAAIETRPSYSSQPLAPPRGQAGQVARQPNSATADITGTTPSPHNWQWEGSTPIIVAQGETVESLALRYNVPGGAIMQANHLNERSALRPGQQIIIPKMKYASSGHVVAPAAPRSPAPRLASAESGTHVVGPGETLMGISRRYHTPVKSIVAANRLTYDARLKVGDTLVIPGHAASVASTAAPASSKLAEKVAPPATPAPKAAPAPQKVASIEPSASVRLASPSVETGESAASGASPQFRWPVRGRVISSFGPIPNGQQNDGINLSVPEGTAVRAADDGTVAYAGNELKGYGNLVLVRHSNGYVTAYAHASELMVKRGDTVRRGQVIAKSGATGSVTAPQLHFEIRKGSAPVDPMKFLPGA